MTIREAIKNIHIALTPCVGDDEARAMAEIIMEEVKGYNKVQLLLYDQRELLPETVDRINRIIDAISGGQPLQYVLCNAQWRGRTFKVNPSVLIPRPETSQLVDMIVDRSADRQDMRVLDIGTGSGCIAISLALDLRYPLVTAVDISAEALATATANARDLHAKVDFVNADAFHLDDVSALSKARYDIIVSNPPYVLDSERKEMDSRVADHEPHLALFVSDDDPIAIYRAIAGYAASHLVENGELYLEINPLCVDMLVSMLAKTGFSDIVKHRDYKGNQRFVICRI